MCACRSKESAAHYDVKVHLVHSCSATGECPTCKPHKLTMQIASNSRHSVWQYRCAASNERHVLKTFMAAAHDALVNEVEAYDNAHQLQGDVLPTLIRVGTLYTVCRSMRPPLLLMLLLCV